MQQHANNHKISNYLSIKSGGRLLCSQKLFKTILINLLLLLCIISNHSIAAETVLLQSNTESTTLKNKPQWIYIAPENRSIYNKFYSQIKQQLKSNNIIRINSNSEIQCNQKNNKTHFFITAGISALKKIKHCTKTSKIFAFYLTQQQFHNLNSESKGSYKNANVFYVDQPLIRQLALARYFLPKSDNVGVIYNQTTQHQIDYFKNRKPKQINLADYPIKSNLDILNQLSKATANSDFILALIDSKTYNSRTAKSILLSTYRKNIPLFGGTKGFVKAGIVASCYSVPEKLVDELTSFIKKNTNAKGARQYPVHFELEMNDAVLNSFDLKTSKKSDIKKYITETLLLWREQQ